MCVCVEYCKNRRQTNKRGACSLRAKATEFAAAADGFVVVVAAAASPAGLTRAVWRAGRGEYQGRAGQGRACCNSNRTHLMTVALLQKKKNNPVVVKQQLCESGRA